MVWRPSGQIDRQHIGHHTIYNAVLPRMIYLDNKVTIYFRQIYVSMLIMENGICLKKCVIVCLKD